MNLVTSELTLRQFHSEVGISKTLKHSPKVLKMLLPGLTYVIYVGSHIGLATSQNVIYRALEYGAPFLPIYSTCATFINNKQHLQITCDIYK